MATPVTVNGVPVTAVPHHRGILGNVEHIGGQFVTDLIDAAVGSAGGLIQGGEYAATHNPLDTLSQLPDIGVAMARQMAADVQHPLRHPGNTFLDALTLLPIPGAIAGRAALIGGTAARGGRLAADLAEATRPAMAAGDLAGARAVARSMGRGDEFARAISPSGEAHPVGRQLRQDILRGAPRQERLLKTPEGDVVHGWIYSRDPTVKAAQKLVDKAYDRWSLPGGRGGVPPPVWRVMPPFWRTQSSRVGRAATAATRQRTTELGSEAQSLWKQFHGLPDEEHLAARMVLEGTTAAEFRNYHEGVLRGEHPDVKLTPRIEKETQRRLDLLTKAEPYLQDTTHTIVGDNGKTYRLPVPELKSEFAGTKVADYIDQMRSMAHERETAFVGADMLSPSSSTARTIAPKHEMLHNELPLYEEGQAINAKKLAGLQRAHGGNPEVWQRMQEQLRRAKEDPLLPEDVAAKLIDQARLARIHYDLPPLRKIRNLSTTGFRSAFRGHSKPSPPGTITHPFKAEVLRRGGGDINTARVQAYTYTEAQRYLALYHNWSRIAASLQNNPDLIPERYRVLVRKPGGPSDVMTRTQAGRFIERQRRGEAPTKDEADLEGMVYEETRKGLFPQQIHDAVAGKLRSIKELAKNNETAPPGYGWADSRLLGGLDKQNPLVSLLSGSPIAQTAVRSLDTINTINKAAILYLKPAYILPNALGNVALNLIQQGFMAPVNLGKSLYVWNRLGHEARQRLLSGMGEGGAQTLGDVSGNVFNRVQQASRGLSRGYGKIVDQPFRISSFLHEAAVGGYTTKAEVEHLLTDPALREELTGISQRANDAIINYEFLSPNEQAIMRRLIFFYPWIKGATRYTAQVYKEHPVATGLQAQGGRLSEQRTEEMLGALPVSMRGLVARGLPNARGIAQTQNPQAFSILETPAHLAEEFLNVVGHNPNAALALAGEMSPSDRAMLDIITGGATGQKRAAATAKTEPPIRTAWNDLTGGNALSLLYSRLRNQSKPTAIYPNQSWIRDLLQFGAYGNLGPRATNIPMANYVAWLEQHPHG